MSADEQSIGMFRGRRVAPRAAVATRRPVQPVATAGEYVNPLSQLVIGDPFRPSALLDGQDPRTRDYRLEMLDAAYEDSEGRLPHEPGYSGRYPTPVIAAPSNVVTIEPAPAQRGSKRKLTTAEAQALYVEHAGGATIWSLARRLADEGRYTHANNAATALRKAWTALGLPFGVELDELRAAA